MKINFSDAAMPDKGALVLPMSEGEKLTGWSKRTDERFKGALKRAVKADQFKGKDDEILEIVAPANSKLDRVFLLGLGKAGDIDELAAQKAGARLMTRLLAGKSGGATLLGDAPKGSKLKTGELFANIAHGAELRSYRFDKYLTKEEKRKTPKIDSLSVSTGDAKGARAAYKPLAKLTEGVFLTRDLVSEPANVIYPESFAAEARKLKDLGVKVEVMGEATLKKLGMGALLAVGHGSERESRVVVMRWEGAPKNRKQDPVAFIGKGVTFDTGGISLKPAQNMGEMKWDMGGAGVVTGLMKALAGRKAKVNAIGVVGLVENMPSGRAQRPGDVVTSMSGQTIEVLNTDAEGRLVLGDVLWYTQKKYKPRAMIDLATLTGAMIVSLGKEMAGLFANDDDLAKQLIDTGKKTGEMVWRFPLCKHYDSHIDSQIADMRNIGNTGEAGSIAAAKFLEQFVNDTKWAHLDIAGMAWSQKDLPFAKKGATGYGVRLLDRLVRDYYEA